MADRSYWVYGKWLHYTRVIGRVLRLCNEHILNIDLMLTYAYKLRRYLVNNIKLLDLYLMDLFYLGINNEPAFCLCIRDIEPFNRNVIKNIRQSSLLLVDTLVLSLSGDLHAVKQVNYFSKWVDMNEVIFTNIWDFYNLIPKKSLSTCELDIQLLRDLYLKYLIAFNNNKNRLYKQESNLIQNLLFN